MNAIPLITRTIVSIPPVSSGPGAPALARLAATECGFLQWAAILIICVCLGTSCTAQEVAKNISAPAPVVGSELNVNWLYGSYVPKDVPLEPLDGHQRFKLYLLQTYKTPGIYVKTTLFALRDQISDSNPEWGDDFEGFAKRLGNRQVQFIIQNSITSSGDALLGWEPRYDRCRCNGFWPRTRHAIVRNFVTYNQSESSLRPQIMPFLGGFGASAIASTWEPGNPKWQVRGYQAAITQVFVGVGCDWLGEFAPEIMRILHKNKRNNR